MSGIRTDRRKALVLGAAMAGASLLAVARKPSRRVADGRTDIRLESLFPENFAGWATSPRPGGIVRPTDESGKLYGLYDQLLERVYMGPAGEVMMLSVAYGTEQSVGLQVHRPEVCYPGGGFKVSGIERVSVPVAGQDLPVTRLLATQPGRSEPVTYWTLLGQSVENDSRVFRWRQIASGLKGEILDGMLVRVSSLDTNLPRAYAQQLQFADALVRSVSPEQRPRVVGVPNTAAS